MNYRGVKWCYRQCTILLQLLQCFLAKTRKKTTENHQKTIDNFRLVMYNVDVGNHNNKNYKKEGERNDAS